jgi:hypothetical protein
MGIGHLLQDFVFSRTRSLILSQSELAVPTRPVDDDVFHLIRYTRTKITRYMGRCCPTFRPGDKSLRLRRKPNRSGIRYDT